jgi:hypothetical protein
MSLSTVDYTRESAVSQIPQSESAGKSPAQRPSESARGITPRKGTRTPTRAERQAARRGRLDADQARRGQAALKRVRDRNDFDADRKDCGRGFRLSGHHRALSQMARLGTGEVFTDLDDMFSTRNEAG